MSLLGKIIKVGAQQAGGDNSDWRLERNKPLSAGYLPRPRPSPLATLFFIHSALPANFLELTKLFAPQCKQISLQLHFAKWFALESIGI